MRLTGDDTKAEDEFDLIWPLIRRHTTFSRNTHPAMLIYGNDHIAGLLAAKLARKAKTGTVVILSTVAKALSAHTTLIDALDIDNVLMCWPPERVNGVPSFFSNMLVQTPLRVDFQYIGVEAFGYALTQTASEFVQAMGSALTLAATTFVEIPDPRVLEAWLNMLSRDPQADSFLRAHPYLGPVVKRSLLGQQASVKQVTTDRETEDAIVDWMKRLCVAFVTEGGIEHADTKVTIDVMPTLLLGQQRRLVRVQHGDAVLKRSIHPRYHSGNENVQFRLQNGLWVESTSSSFLHQLDRTPQQQPVTTEFLVRNLLDMGLLNVYRGNLLREYLGLASAGIITEVSQPAKLSIRCARLSSSLVYMSNSQLHNFCAGVLGSQSLVSPEMTKQTVASWREAMALPAGNFSLLNYACDDPGLGGEQARSIAIDVAQRHPSSTVVAFAPHTKAKKLSKQLDALGVRNVLPIKNHADKDIISRLYRSPEFFQYQTMGNLLHFMHSMGREAFGTFLEQVLSISSTTFFSMPSGKLLSEAMSLFYGIAADTFNHAGKKLLLETISNSRHIMSVAFHSYPQPSGSSIVRVVTTNMSRTVHHHFDYEIDGHSRTYRMRSNGPHDVFLVRELDDSKVPYTVDGVPIHYGLTLISILRLGVTTEWRDKLYGSFLAMPLYEDMAPWNIFFEKDKLIYIDYDTRSFQFDSAVPMAYQVSAYVACGDR
jgi:hypothetical protein